MPPPSFSSAGVASISISRALQASVREASQGIVSALKHVPSALSGALASCSALLADPGLEIAPAELLERPSLPPPDAKTAALRAAVAEKVNAALVQAVEAGATRAPPAPEPGARAPSAYSTLSDAITIHDQQVAPLLALLEALAPLLGAELLVNVWWTRAIYPALAHSSSAHQLAVFLLLSVSPSEYPAFDTPRDDDEPELPHEPTRGDALYAFAQRTFRVSTAPGVADALVAFGTLAPARFYFHVAELLVDDPAPLHLLIAFMQQHVLHIYRSTATPLPPRLVGLMLQTHDAWIQTLAIGVLSMMVPHMPLWIVHGGAGGLSALFHAYTRTLLWPAGADAPESRPFFTLLYGLFPCDTLRFLRSPLKYLHEREYSGPLGWEDDIEDGAVLAHSQAFLRTHAVHPLLLEFNAASEALETRRWLQQDASDLVALCTSLYLERGGAARADAAGILDTHLALRTREHGEAAESARLRTALHFELFLKEQHLQHIGRLHRDRIAAAAAEAEHQNLYATVRSLGVRLQIAQTTHDRQRAELQAATQRHQQWERELNTKLNTYRDERRRWTHEAARLQRQLAEARETITLQARRAAVLGARLFELETDLVLVRPKLDRIDEYDSRVQQLSSCLANWEDDIAQYDEQRGEMATLLSRWSEMELIVKNSEASAHEAREVAEREAQRAARLQRQVDALSAQRAHQHERAAARWTATPEMPRPMRDPTIAARNAELESEVLRLHAHIDMLHAERRMAEMALNAAQESRTSSAAPEEHALYSPSLLQTPAPDAIDDDDTVPPLQLG